MKMEEQNCPARQKKEAPPESGEALCDPRKALAFQPPVEEEARGPLGEGAPPRIARWVKGEVWEGPDRCWETQLQDFVKQMESPCSGQASRPFAEGPTLWDDAKAFLDSFEQVAEACRWPRGEWVARLLPALSGEAEQVFERMLAKDKGDYEKVKAAVLQGEAQRREKLRQRFRRFCYQEADGPAAAYNHLQDLCRRWLKAERHSKEQVLELLILEQFLAILPSEIQSWVGECGPQSCSQAVGLAEEFLRQQRTIKDQRKSEVNFTEESSCETGQPPREAEQSQLCPETKQENEERSAKLPAGEVWEDENQGDLFRVSPEVHLSALQEKVCHQDGLNVAEEIPPETSSAMPGSPFQGGDLCDSITQEPAVGKRKKMGLDAAWVIHRGEPPNGDLTFGKKSVAAERQVKPHQCFECGKRFCQSLNLALPQRSHTAERTFSCVSCFKSTKQSPSLVQNKQIHTGEKHYRCPKSAKSFRPSTSLISHQRTHPGEKPFTCSHCGKGFSHQSGFVKHKTVHTGERPYKCLECGKSFSQSTHLTGHRRIHTGERPYKCFACHKTFRDKSGLVKHQRTHTGQKPYQCVVCGRCFSQSTNLIRHRRVHSGGKVAMLTPHVLSGTGEIQHQTPAVS